MAQKRRSLPPPIQVGTAATDANLMSTGEKECHARRPASAFLTLEAELMLCMPDGFGSFYFLTIPVSVFPSVWTVLLAAGVLTALSCVAADEGLSARGTPRFAPAEPLLSALALLGPEILRCRLWCCRSRASIRRRTTRLNRSQRKFARGYESRFEGRSTTPPQRISSSFLLTRLFDIRIGATHRSACTPTISNGGRRSLFASHLLMLTVSVSD
jgi:hypothetical protein